MHLGAIPYYIATLHCFLIYACRSEFFQHFLLYVLVIQFQRISVIVWLWKFTSAFCTSSAAVIWQSLVRASCNHQSEALHVVYCCTTPIECAVSYPVRQPWVQSMYCCTWYSSDSGLFLRKHANYHCFLTITCYEINIHDYAETVIWKSPEIFKKWKKIQRYIVPLHMGFQCSNL